MAFVTANDYYETKDPSLIDISQSRAFGLRKQTHDTKRQSGYNVKTGKEKVLSISTRLVHIQKQSGKLKNFEIFLI
jgi:hypothetical protein